MGIKGLLKELRPLFRRCHVSELRGRYVGIDAFCWLHRGSYSCAMDLVLGRPTDKFLVFCKNMLSMLLHHGIKPLVVFDGPDKPKMKEATANARKESRERSKMEGLKFLELGEVSKANEMFQRAVHISSEMVQKFMELLEQLAIPYVRAPYEGNCILSIFFRFDFKYLCSGCSARLFV